MGEIHPCSQYWKLYPSLFSSLPFFLLLFPNRVFHDLVPLFFSDYEVRTRFEILDIFKNCGLRSLFCAEKVSFPQGGLGRATNFIILNRNKSKKCRNNGIPGRCVRNVIGFSTWSRFGPQTHIFSLETGQRDFAEKIYQGFRTGVFRPVNVKSLIWSWLRFPNPIWSF